MHAPLQQSSPAVTTPHVPAHLQHLQSAAAAAMPLHIAHQSTFGSGHDAGHGSLFGNRIGSAIAGNATDPDGKQQLVPDDLDLDFEEISDGELEEEARIRSLGDALGVDWASLVDESKAIARERRAGVADRPCAKERWQAHRILLDVGVSFRQAGAEYASDVLNAAQRQLQADEDAAVALAKAKVAQTASEGNGLLQIKKEIIDEDDLQPAVVKEDVDAGTDVTADDTKPPTCSEPKPEQKSEPAAEAAVFFHPIACVQVANRAAVEQRKTLVLNVTGTFSRALCAERDIAMRRRLCGLATETCDGEASSRPTAVAVPSKFAEQARELFEAALVKAAAY